MDFRRSGQLDERRRRVLMDEIATPADDDTSQTVPTAGGGSAKGPVRAYCPAVLAERQPRVTDLVPVRPAWVTMLALLALTGIATIETIHIYAQTTPLAAESSQLAALDVRQRGSLAASYSSALLALAAAAAVGVFAIRQHRVDDYAGRYRIWLWTAAALGFGSLDAATGLHEGLGLGLTLLAGSRVAETSLAAACTLAWLAVYALVFGTLAIRLAIEIWPSLPSFAALAGSGLFYFLSGLAELGMLPVADPLLGAVAESSLAMLAHLMLASSIVLFARHVHLDAQGRLKVHIDPDRKKKIKAKPRAKLKVVNSEAGDAAKAGSSPVASKSNEPARFGAAAGSTKASASISKPPAHYDDEDEDEDDDGGEKLSKAERRRLKKMARRETQRRAA